MKIILHTILFSSLMTFSHLAISCDQACQEAKLKKIFPKYVTQSYCRDVRDEFLSSTLHSVDSFIHEKMNTRYKGSIRNTRNYLAQHLDWVKECDEFLSATNEKRIFNSNTMTEKMYKLTHKVIKSFDDILAGIEHVNENGEKNTLIKDDFKHLRSTAENHRNLMHLRGTYAFN